MRRWCAVVVAMAVVSTAGTAVAGNYSPLTIGVGGGIGVLHEAQPDGDPSSTFVNQANVRLKALWFLGLDFAYNLGRDEIVVKPGEELQYAARMRMTALIYAVPTKTVGFYLGVGVGGDDIGELGSFDAPGNSYHGGAGLEVNVSDHVSIDASFMMIVPGIRSVENHVEHLALSAVEDQNDVGETGGTQTQANPLAPDSVGASDFFDLRNFELMVRIYLFL
ncbi:MAG: hypothetical protein ACI9MR_001668 [Myxococcota bacterium]|jgi:hypothetical protein